MPVFFLQVIRIILAYRDKLVSKSCSLVKWLGSDDPDPVAVTTPSCLAPVIFRPAAVQFAPSLPACHCLHPPMIRARGVSGATSLAMATRLAGADRRLACSCLAQPSPRLLSRRSRASLGTLGDWRWRCRRLRCRPRGLVGRRWWCGCCLTGSGSSLQPLFLQPLTVNSPTRQPPQALKILYSTDSIKDLRRSGLPFGRWRFGAESRAGPGIWGSPDGSSHNRRASPQ